MPNPPLFVCDSDALIQLFLTKKFLPLRELRASYGIQPMITTEVEMELSWTPKFGNRFEPDLKKAKLNGTIQLLDETSLQKHIGDSVARAVFSSIQSRGAEYSKHVQRGEAYTFAAAVDLGVPALSNDKAAIDVLQWNNFNLPSPVLRAFDLFAFGYQIGVMSDAECDEARKVLLRAKEHIPGAFSNASFTNGLKVFCPRLLDSSKRGIGAFARPSTSYDRQVSVSPIV